MSCLMWKEDHWPKIQETWVLVLDTCVTLDMLHGLSGPQLSSLTNGGSTCSPPQLSPSPVKLTCCSAGGV